MQIIKRVVTLIKQPGSYLLDRLYRSGNIYSYGIVHIKSSQKLLKALSCGGIVTHFYFLGNYPSFLFYIFLGKIR